MNKGQILKGFGRLTRPTSAVASFILGLLILRLVYHSSCSRMRNSKWNGGQIPSITMRDRKLFPESKQEKQLLAS